MKHGARNDIPAEVLEIKTGGVMAHVTVKLRGTDYTMSSVMTIDSPSAMMMKSEQRSARCSPRRSTCCW